MLNDHCQYCGKSADLVEFNEELYCKGWCVEQAREAAKINEADDVKEDEKLWK